MNTMLTPYVRNPRCSVRQIWLRCDRRSHIPTQHHAGAAGQVNAAVCPSTCRLFCAVFSTAFVITAHSSLFHVKRCCLLALEERLVHHPTRRPFQERRRTTGVCDARYARPLKSEGRKHGVGPAVWLAGWLGRPGATQPVTSGRGFNRSGGRASWGRHELRTLCRQCRFLSRTVELPDLLQHCTARECRVGNRGVSRETRQSCTSIQ